MLNKFRVVALVLLVSAHAVSQSKVMVCWTEPTALLDKNPFSQDNELRRKGRIGLMQPDHLDLTRIALPSELRPRPARDAKEINLPDLKWQSGNCQLADREPNGALQFH